MINFSLSSAPIVQQYDLIISTQEEFDAFVSSCNNSTCTAKTVAILKGTYTLSTPVQLPDTLKVLDGFDRPKLEISYSASDGNEVRFFSYASFPNDTSSYRVSGFDVNLNFAGKRESQSIQSHCFVFDVPYVYNCYVFATVTQNSQFFPPYRTVLAYIGSDNSFLVNCTIATEQATTSPGNSSGTVGGIGLTGQGINCLLDRNGITIYRAFYQESSSRGDTHFESISASSADIFTATITGLTVDMNATIEHATITDATITDLTVTNLEYTEPSSK